MSPGTKNRQKQTADLCKQHLREKYPDRPRLVEEFIAEIEGPPRNCDLTGWSQLSDIKDIKKGDVPAASRFDSKTGSASSPRCARICEIVSVQNAQTEKHFQWDSYSDFFEGAADDGPVFFSTLHDSNWIFEMKWGGYRALAAFDSG